LREKKKNILLFKKVAVLVAVIKNNRENRSKKGKIVFLEPQKGENCYFFGK